jgi:uncharacterized OsmC-like protein
MSMATATRKHEHDDRLNGWSVEAFNATVDAVREAPETGKLVWRSRTLWDSGFGGDVHLEDIEQAGNVIRRTFTVRSDHPPELLGHDTGPTAVEILLCGLGACVMGTYAAHATARGIQIDALEVELEGAIDLNGFLQLSSTRAGLSGVRATVRVQSAASDSDLRELLDVTRRASPVYDSVSNPVSIQASVERMSR